MTDFSDLEQFILGELKYNYLERMFMAHIGDCDCSLPPGSTYYHCRSCCSTYSSISLWEEHRSNGVCYELEGVYEEDGVLSTEEGHNRRKLLSRRFSKNLRGQEM